MLTAIKTFLLSVLAFLLIFSLCAFAVMNRQIVFLVWNPLGQPFELPLYAIALSFFGLGFLLGGVIVWSRSWKRLGAPFQGFRKQDKFKTALQESGLS